jgi:hypothetical protein
MSISKQLWPLVIVGKGTAAAFYVCTVDLELYRHVLAIGDDDAWSANKRGHHGSAGDPTLGLNHPLHLVQHFKDKVPGFSEVMVDRLKWAEMNAEVLRECHVQTHNGKVIKVTESVIPEELAGEKGTIVNGYKIEINNNDPVYACKVVMAAGAGEHRLPKEFENVKQRFPTRVMDMDAFAKLGAGELKKETKVVVFGPNAAIDCIQKGAFYKCDMTWMINTSPDKLPILATQPMVKKWVETNGSKIFVYDTFNFPMGNLNDLRVQAYGKKGDRNVRADIIVYGLGQTGEPVKAIDMPIQTKLKPILDINNYLGGGQNTILGYESEGTNLKSGFEVVGALTAQVGRARLQILKDQIKALRSVKTLLLAISNAKFPVKMPFLLKDPDFLAKQPVDVLKSQLKTEGDWVKKQNTTNIGVPEAVDGLINILLAYHNANNYAKHINQAAHDLPKGTVADGGQITTIRSMMAAKHQTEPKYMPKQSFTTPGPTAKGPSAPKGKGQTNWVDVKQTKGEVDFNSNNATLLQMGLTQMYPFIPGSHLSHWINGIMLKRHNSDVGFNDLQVAQFHKELTTMNDNALLFLNNLA